MLLKKCSKCKNYTLKERCCVPTTSPHPPKFLLSDRYGKYRRAAKHLN